MKTTSLTALGIAALSASSIAFAATDKAGTAPSIQEAAAGPSDRPAATRDAAPQTRDWAKADADRDHLISPDEMEAYLQANPGPLNPARAASK